MPSIPPSKIRIEVAIRQPVTKSSIVSAHAMAPAQATGDMPCCRQQLHRRKPWHRTMGSKQAPQATASARASTTAQAMSPPLPNGSARRSACQGHGSGEDADRSETGACVARRALSGVMAAMGSKAIAPKGSVGNDRSAFQGPSASTQSELCHTLAECGRQTLATFGPHTVKSSQLRSISATRVRRTCLRAQEHASVEHYSKVRRLDQLCFSHLALGVMTCGLMVLLSVAIRPCDTTRNIVVTPARKSCLVQKGTASLGHGVVPVILASRRCSCAHSPACCSAGELSS